MKGSSQKDLAVYDFNEEEEAVEAASEEYTAKLQSKLSPRMEDGLTKYNFLHAFTAGLNFKGTDVTDILCVDLHGRDNMPQSYALESPETNLTSLDEKAESDEHGHLRSNEFEPMSLTREHSAVAKDSSLLTELRPNKMVVDMISDDEECWTSGFESSSTTDSDIPRNAGYLEQPVSDGCYAAYEEMVENDPAVTVHPDFVTYGSTLYVEPRLTFLADCIKIEYVDSGGDDENIVIELGISEIIHIDCQWTESVEAALVRISLRANTEDENEKEQFGKVRFAVTDLHWLEKEQKIKILAQRYRDIWKSISHDDLVWDSDDTEPNLLFPRQYFTGIVEPFEDVIYPRGDPDAVSISKRDIELLLPETFINDTIIDFYIKYLKDKIQANEKQRFHFFNSFFFRKLADLDKDSGKASGGRAAFLRVRKWTRKVNIFEKDYIFIPVNFNLHWSLLVICHPGEIATFGDGDLKESPKVPCILHMDSIKGSHSGLKNIIQSYLWEEWKERHPEFPDDNSAEFLNLRFVSLELPQQENSFDCGLFLLHYVELFLQDAPIAFNPFKITKFSSFLSAEWFPPADASLKRSLIRKLIYELLDDSSQKNVPSCRNGHLTKGYTENNDVEQEPIVEYLVERCCPAKLVDPVYPIPSSDGGIETKVLARSHVCAAESDGRTGLVLENNLETGSISVSSIEDGKYTHQHDSPCQMLTSATCTHEERLDKELAQSGLDGEDSRLPVVSAHSQICSSSCSHKDGINETKDSSTEGKDNYVDSSLESLNAAIVVSNEDEAIKTGTPLTENFGYVPDSPTLSSGEKLNVCAEGSQISPINPEDGNCKVAQEIDKIKLDVDDGVGSKETKTNEDEFCTSEAITGAIEAGDRIVDDCMELDSRKADSGAIQDNQADGNTMAMDGDDAVRQKVNTYEPETVLSDEACRENVPSASFHDIVITDDESPLNRDEVLVDDTRTEPQPSKRRKILIPEGVRRRTRSSVRDSST
ncbi:probable ubiquitin-like-specific protease 2B isoform X2 [Typha latifolia]|uniref:probable ubiquitin-like-specific protease 2B isoform X2 n=1 Tax=Typha latifolia TaxID=4733 RepID=UPI003C2C88A1